jgi:hypothetical protein
MEEKRKDLNSTKSKAAIADIVAELNTSHPSFYYLSTIEIAAEVKKYIHHPGNLDQQKFELLRDLSRRDIQMFLSLHDRK